MAEYKELRSMWAELFDKFTMGVAIMVIETDEKGLPTNLVWDYMNQAYADLYKKPRDFYMGKSLNDVIKGDSRKWIYNAWNTACNGVQKETEHYDANIKKYLSFNFFQLEYGVCCCVARDNTVNHRLNEMVQDNFLLQNSHNYNADSTEEYIFEYRKATDEFRYLKCPYDSENKEYKKISDFKNKYLKKLNIIGCSFEDAERVFCSKSGGRTEMKIINPEGNNKNSIWYKVSSSSVSSKKYEYLVVGTIKKIVEK